MSRGLGRLQTTILAVLQEREARYPILAGEPLSGLSGATTREIMEQAFACPHRGRHAACLASHGYTCSPDVSKKQLMVRTHRALSGLAARDLVEGIYTHYSQFDETPAHPAITIAWRVKKGDK